MPSPVNCACSSSNVTSGCAASKARTRSSWLASANGFLPPIRAGATLPLHSQRCSSLIAQLTLTANCSAASRRELPASIASTIRSRRSNDSGRGIHAGLLNSSCQLESRFALPGNPSRFYYSTTRDLLLAIEIGEYTHHRTQICESAKGPHASKKRLCSTFAHFGCSDANRDPSRRVARRTLTGIFGPCHLVARALHAASATSIRGIIFAWRTPSRAL